MIRTLADQYLAQNAGRRYPLADDAGYEDVPDDTAILDFRCTLRDVQSGTAPRPRLMEVETVAGAKRLTVAVIPPDHPGVIAALVFDIPGTMPLGAPYVAVARDESTGAEGRLVVSASVLGLADGPKAVPFAWTTVICDALKVHSLQSAQGADAVDDDDPAGRNVTNVLAGDVLLAEGRNAEPYLDGSRLRIDVFKGGGLGERCQSAATGSQRCSTVLFTVNGERPGLDGELRIVGDNGITVVPDPENHAVEIRMDDVATARMADGCAPACPRAPGGGADTQEGDNK